MSENTETTAAADLALRAATPRFVGVTPMVIVPNGYEAKSLENLLPAPTRKRGKVILEDAASFIAFVRNQLTDSTRLYGSLTNPAFMAVINDHHTPDAPGWRDYQACYSCPLSVEWLTWAKNDGKPMKQEDFAAFIEDNLPDIAKPPAAEMLEISRSLEAKKQVNFASGIRLSNGQNELVYEEQVTGTAQKGKLTVPEEFTIGIPVLEGGEGYAVTARLRYRIGDGGKMAMWYDLLRPHKIIEDAASAVWKQIEEGTGLRIYKGRPA